MNNLTPPEGNLDKKLQYFAKFETEKGDFTAILYPNEAPLTVENFINLWYQSGRGPTKSKSKGKTQKKKHEFWAR